MVIRQQLVRQSIVLADPLAKHIRYEMIDTGQRISLYLGDAVATLYRELINHGRHILDLEEIQGVLARGRRLRTHTMPAFVPKRIDSAIRDLVNARIFRSVTEFGRFAAVARIIGWV